VRRLGVNIDHVATLRNARGEFHPDPVLAAKFVKKSGADSITIHLREDRRHINDFDAKKICSVNDLLVNLEISTKPEMIKKALEIKPNFVCIVPENRKEITTEGGLNIKKNKLKIKKIISKFKKKKIRTSLFINASLDNIKLSSELKVDCIEIHTGKLSNLVKANKDFSLELLKIKRCSLLGSRLGLEIHAGHGLDYKTTKLLAKINVIKEFNIGHYLIGESVFFGFSKVIKNFKEIIKKTK
tara:strand:- start:334 stop:1059 length:726 start_codon:yes stop_codon:yes gene_type:complete